MILGLGIGIKALCRMGRAAAAPELHLLYEMKALEEVNEARPMLEVASMLEGIVSAQGMVSHFGSPILEDTGKYEYDDEFGVVQLKSCRAC